MIVGHRILLKKELVTARFFDLIRLRLPWLIVGLFGGAIAGIIVSRFELSLRENVSLAFFIPIVAYMSDAIGTQTETIFIRALTDLKFNIPRYITRELVIGATMGSVIGVVAGVFGYILSNSLAVGQVVGISLFLSMTIATALACITPLLLRKLKNDPAVGSGPFTTALQDVVSLTIYFLVAAAIL
ncbi:magnesium transporter [Candidatus Microgenomates bacterium]|nr:magnesium transporter [Candidatus Microgenomates bacterium]